MNYREFFIFVTDNISSLIFFTIVSVLIYLIVYKKYIQSVFDPMFLIVIIAGLSASTVFFLYFNNEIKFEYFYKFIITEISFIIGFFIIRPVNFKTYFNNNDDRSTNLFSDRFVKILFYQTSITHICLQILTYILVGIPLLLDSRMATYSGGSGFGIVGRLIEISSGFGMFLLIYRMLYLKNNSVNKIYNYTYLTLVIIFLLLSGSKTNLLFLIYYMFFVNIFMLKINSSKVKEVLKKSIRIQRIILYFSIPLIFLIMYIQFVNTGGDGNEHSPLIALGQRIISFGDIFYLSFPNDVIKSMDSTNGFLQLFKDPLGMLRITSWEELPIDCGIQVYKYHYNNEMISGPNPRYNYFSILYFNEIGQIIFCFIIGLITSFIRNTFFKILPNNIVLGSIYTLFAINIIYLYQDQSFFIAKYFNNLIFIPIILFTTLGIEYLTSKNK